MTPSFFAYIVHYNGSGAPVLSKKQVSIGSQSRFSLANNSEKTYLAGGFTSCSEQEQIPISPTLQLNGDLTDLSLDDLQNIGLAELGRINGTTIRSYIQEPDNRVAVFSSNEEALTNFLETYGGVLHIEPLLTGSYHADYPTAEDIEIENATDDGYRIQYLVRKPIDLEKCSYCGACGPVCPEDCLNEDLFVDVSRCSYCNECIKACPAQAIDLYRVEKFDLKFPAIILLDKPKLQLPDDVTNVYHPEELQGLFSRLIPVSIEETVAWTHDCCQYSNRKDTGCTACLDACKHSAIGKNQDKITINHGNCVECGACMATCPTGALQYQRFSDKQLIDWFELVRPAPNTTIVIGSEQDLHKLWWKNNTVQFDSVLFLEYPKARALTAMHMLFLLSLGADRVILLDKKAPCEGKPIAAQVKIANTIFNALYKGNDRITIATSANIPSLNDKMQPSALSEQYANFKFTHRRDKLGSILSFLIEHSSEKVDIPADEPFQTFGSVQCEAELCTHCGACLNECRIEALSADSETLSLDHKSIHCVQCGTCVSVCPENALSLKPGLVLAPEFITPRELTRAEPIRCIECGKPFGTKKSYERIVAILKTANTGNMNTDVLEYCETCRVVKIFEAHQQ